MQIMRTFAGRTIVNFASKANTVIGAVATNARLTKDEANKVAQMAHNGLARTIFPAHTMFDRRHHFLHWPPAKRMQT
jgi:L-aminopeptidase/D-esterase-like protein